MGLLEELAVRCEAAVNSCRDSAIATGGEKWVASVDEFVASLRAADALALSKGSDT